MKFKIGDKVICKGYQYDVMTIKHRGNMFDWSVTHEDGQSNVYDENELELFIEDEPVKDIVWHYIVVDKYDIAIKLNELGLKPGEFSLLDHTDYTALLIYNYPKNS